jgi:hypothetical protein
VSFQKSFTASYGNKTSTHCFNGCKCYNKPGFAVPSSTSIRAGLAQSYAVLFSNSFFHSKMFLRLKGELRKDQDWFRAYSKLQKLNKSLLSIVLMRSEVDCEQDP